MSNKLWVERVRTVPGRPGRGQWIHLSPKDSFSGAADLEELRERGGRLNPPGTFPVAYFSEDSAQCRRALDQWSREEPELGERYTVLVAEIHLDRVIDLSDPLVCARLDLIPEAWADSEEWTLGQSIGAAAYEAGFQGVLYPRPGGGGVLNLAAFCDRTGGAEIQIVGARSLRL